MNTKPIQSKPTVQLLAYTPNPISVIFSAFRQCYFNGFIGDSFSTILEGSPNITEQERFIEDLVKAGHASPLEHVSFTFAIEGISRALSHQLVRHRIASYSQQSQRYVTGKDFSYITPPSIAKNPKALAKYTALMEIIQKEYNELVDIFKEQDIKAKECIEDIRFILPQASETRIVVTMNCRALLNFFEHRCCLRAQWEIRNLANIMRKQCTQILPCVFKKSGAICFSTRICPEPKHLACGLYPTKD